MESNGQVMAELIMELSNDVRTIKEALLGNPLRKDSGISGAVVDHEERITKLEDKANLVKYFIIGLGLATGSVGAFLFEFLKGLIAVKH